MKKITPDDYRAFREVHGRAGSYDEVRLWCAGQDILRAEFEASQEAECAERLEKLRRRIAANWRPFWEYQQPTKE